MATKQPISTISYNTEPFLRERLDQWVQAHIIQAYMYIYHKGEDGDKDHIHLRIEPNKTLDVMDLTEDLKEYVQGEKLPRVVRPWRPSKEEDWIEYVVHDEDYLRIKYKSGEKGEKLPYKWQDIKASEGFDVEIAFIRARQKLEHTTANMAQRLKGGEQALTLISEGENVFQVNAIQRALQGNDYERLSQEVSDLGYKLGRLLEAVDSAGLVVVSDDEGNPKLEPKPKPIKLRGVAPSGEAPGTASGNASERFTEIPSEAAALPEQFIREETKQ